MSQPVTVLSVGPLSENNLVHSHTKLSALNWRDKFALCKAIAKKIYTVLTRGIGLHCLLDCQGFYITNINLRHLSMLSFGVQEYVVQRLSQSGILLISFTSLAYFIDRFRYDLSQLHESGIVAA